MNSKNDEGAAVWQVGEKAGEEVTVYATVTFGKALSDGKRSVSVSPLSSGSYGLKFTDEMGRETSIILSSEAMLMLCDLYKLAVSGGESA